MVVRNTAYAVSRRGLSLESRGGDVKRDTEGLERQYSVGYVLGSSNDNRIFNETETNIGESGTGRRCRRKMEGV